jgi:hypothetical protein
MTDARDRVARVIDLKLLATHHGIMNSNPPRNLRFFHVRKLSSWLMERRLFYSGALLCQEYALESMRSSCVSKAGKPRYDLYIAGVKTK